MSEATVRCPKCGHGGIVITELLNSDLLLIADSQAAEIERLTEQIAAEQAENEDLKEQLREQTKSFCTHCGTLFPKGKEGIAAFRAHVFECENHPTSEIIRWAQAMVTALAVGDVASGSKLHHKLRDTMIAYREAARAAGGEEES